MLKGLKITIKLFFARLELFAHFKRFKRIDKKFNGTPYTLELFIRECRKNKIDAVLLPYLYVPLAMSINKLNINMFRIFIRYYIASLVYFGMETNDKRMKSIQYAGILHTCLMSLDVDTIIVSFSKDCVIWHKDRGHLPYTSLLIGISKYFSDIVAGRTSPEINKVLAKMHILHRYITSALDTIWEHASAPKLSGTGSEEFKEVYSEMSDKDMLIAGLGALFSIGLMYDGKMMRLLPVVLDINYLFKLCTTIDAQYCNTSLHKEPARKEYLGTLLKGCGLL